MEARWVALSTSASAVIENDSPSADIDMRQLLVVAPRLVHRGHGIEHGVSAG